MLERRVVKLEDDMADVKSSLKAIEIAVAEIKHLPKMADFLALKTDVAEIKGRLMGVEGRLQHIPNTWQIIGILFAVASALYAASRFIR